MKWKYLKPGDIIDIVATAPGVEIRSLEKDMEILVRFIESLGLKPRLNLNAIAKSSAFFDDTGMKIRQDELIRSITAEDSSAIWFLRGGYGTSKLLGELEKLKQPQNPKLLIGFSDLNAIHLWVSKFWNWPSVHYRNLYDFIKKQNFPDFDVFKKIIFGRHDNVIYDTLIPINNIAKDKSHVIGKITGGTIQVLQSGIGLPWQFDARNKILLLEEVFDRGVRLDRSLYHFNELKLFEDVKAIIFGDIVCGLENDGSQICDQAVSYFAKNINIPVYQMPDIGHDSLNYPLPLNTEATISPNGNKTIISVTTGGV